MTHLNKTYAQPWNTALAVLDHCMGGLRLCLFIALIFSVTGCSSSQRVQKEYRQSVSEIYDLEIAPKVPAGSATGQDETRRTDQPGQNNAPTMLTLEDAFLLASSGDPVLRKLLIKTENSDIDIKQARSLLWPRLHASVTYETTLDNSSRSMDNSLERALVFKYDLFDAIFSPDAVSLRKVQKRQVQFKRNMAARKLYYKIVRLFASINRLADERNRWELSAKLAHDGKEMLELRSGTGGGIFQDKIDELHGQWELYQLKSMEAGASMNIKLMEARNILGLSPLEEVEITDLDDYLPKPEQHDENAGGIQNAVSRAWRQRDDIRVSELDLYIAHMKVLVAKRSRYSDISFSLGLGENLTTETGDTGEIVPYLSVSIPIIDFGDTRRKVRKARNSTSFYKVELARVARELSLSIARLRSKKDILRQELAISSGKLEKSRARVESMSLPAKSQQVDALDFIKERLALYKAENDHSTLLNKYLDLSLELKEAMGDAIPNMEDHEKN